MKYLFLFLITISLFSSCTTSKSLLHKLDWLDGKWHAKVDGNDVFESWELKGDSIWIGESAFVKDGKELFTELMSIQLVDDKMIFNSAVSNQNDAKQVFFKEVSWGENKIVFENKEHDFPQNITYELKSEGKMLAFISGDLNEVPQRINFNFTKVK